jgi:hypothetical protein
MKQSSILTLCTIITLGSSLACLKKPGAPQPTSIPGSQDDQSFLVVNGTAPGAPTTQEAELAGLKDDFLICSKLVNETLSPERAATIILAIQVGYTAAENNVLGGVEFEPLGPIELTSDEYDALAAGCQQTPGCSSSEVAALPNDIAGVSRRDACASLKVDRILVGILTFGWNELLIAVTC